MKKNKFKDRLFDVLNDTDKVLIFSSHRKLWKMIYL